MSGLCRLGFWKAFQIPSQVTHINYKHPLLLVAKLSCGIAFTSALMALLYGNAKFYLISLSSLNQLYACDVLYNFYILLAFEEFLGNCY